MKSTKLTLLLAFPLVALISCKKEISRQQEHTIKELDKSKIYKLPETSEEKLLVDNLTKVTAVLKNLYKNKENLKLVNAALFSKAYTDQSVPLKDLIYPEASRLTVISKFNKYAAKFDVSLNQFSNNFWHEVSKLNDASFNQFLNNLKPVNRSANLRTETFDENGDDVTIYFPYMEEFLEPIDETGGYYEPITSVVTATADADEGWGEQPYYINGVFQYYVQVLVNDDYAENYPTHIVGVNGIEPYNEPPIANSAFPPGGPVDLPNLPREVKQVYVGDVRCKTQYDALISFTGNGGGSEIRFTRADGFLKLADGQVQADMFVVGDASISRYSIRKRNWVNYSKEWDGDWEDINFQENLAIYEEDNRNTSTFTGSLSTTAAITVAPAVITATRTIGFTLNFKSDDALIKQTNYNRDVFFILNRTDLEGEMKDGWPVRDRYANVSFTLNDRTYY
ncbi:MAG: hypothetical protein ACOVP7_09365 [Lacibacter sp.]